jgi:SAM-dependent methyltransferase
VTSYASMTHEDRNPLKRWLQGRRLGDALALIPPSVRRVVDFGGGDGVLTQRLATTRPGILVICFEPTPSFCWEAEQRLKGIDGVSLVASETDIPEGWAQAVVCAEVFEHLTDQAMDDAIGHIARILEPGGLLILGVPVETGAPALLKGLFRFLRRPGSDDARPIQIFKAFARRPHGPRFTLQIAEGRPYHPLHIGFDYRAMIPRLTPRFDIVGRRGSPWPGGPSALNSELYVVARKRPA